MAPDAPVAAGFVVSVDVAGAPVAGAGAVKAGAAGAGFAVSWAMDRGLSIDTAAIAAPKNSGRTGERAYMATSKAVQPRNVAAAGTVSGTVSPAGQRWHAPTMPKTAEIAAPDEQSLHEAALRHLGRYGTTVAGLIRVLDRRVARWQRAAAPTPEAVAAARAAVRAVAARMAASGVVDDAAFAQARVRRLARGGRSRLAIAAHLAARGVGADLTSTVLPENGEQELAAAVSTTRRRRIGPFRAGPADADTKRRELGVLARAGFAQPIARKALGLSREAAEAMLQRIRAG